MRTLRRLRHRIGDLVCSQRGDRWEPLTPDWRLFDEYPLYWCPVCLRVEECVCAETSTRNCPVHAPR